MFKNHFKIAFRNLLKNRIYSFINIFGLTAGIACFLLIALYVFDELTFDRFHKNTPNLYRTIEHITKTDGSTTQVAGAGYQVSTRAVTDVPGVKGAVRLLRSGRVNYTDPATNKTIYDDYWETNQSFLDLLDFGMIAGDRTTALKAPNSIVLTEETALKLFGSTAVAGKTLHINRAELPYKVTGVIENFPSNSHVAVNFLVSEGSQQNERYKTFILTDWSSSAFSTYLLLDPSANVTQVTAQLNRLVKANKTATDNAKSFFTLQPFSAIHFYSAGIESNTGRNGNITYIYVFSILALFVLFIACINYMNLTTARFSNRVKEIAVRKVAGAARRQLISQFLSEALLLTLIALAMGILVVQMALPPFNGFTGKQLTLGFTTDYRIWAGVLLAAICVGLLSGIYPAFIQSRLKPLQLLKNKITTGRANLSIRQALVVFQFTLSIIMIVATLIVYLQLEYINEKDMGFNRDGLVIVDINSRLVRRDAETIKTEIAKLAAVKQVTVTSRVPGEWKNIPKVKIALQGKQEASNSMYFIGADEQFLKTYEMKLVQGRNFQGDNSIDSSSILVNEAAAQLLGITTAAEQWVTIPATDFGGNLDMLEHPIQARIVGIVKDFNFRSLRETVAPMVIGWRNNPIHIIDYFSIRMSTAQASKTLAQVDDILHRTDPAHLLESNFLDKQWELFYREDEQRRTIFMAIAIMTILVACLGLFGLATYAGEQRTKEIGIRKVLGASVSGIVAMLSKDFLKLVMIASVIALPIAGWLMHNWLKDFAYRISVSWWILAAAAMMAIVIAIATISFQAIRAALTNPVKSLRTE